MSQAQEVGDLGLRGLSVMAEMLGRVLIIGDQRDFACRVGAIAERLGYATRILQHTLDFVFVMEHWRPGVVAVQMEMPDQQDVEVLEYLERAGYRGRILMTGDFKKRVLENAAGVARGNGLSVVSVLTKSSSSDQIEGALKLLLNLERAA